jgi:hypothetical protein
MSGYSEDDIRRAADIREWLVKQIADKQEEVERLRTTLAIIDSLLKQGSFKAAASLGSFAEAGSTAATAQVQQQARQAPTPPAAAARQQAAAPTLKTSDRDVRPLKRAKDEFLLANAEVSSGAVIIVPAPGVSLSVNTPPFRSFFLNRILEGMKGKDTEKVRQGALREQEALNYKVEEDNNGQIKRIVINNYRDKDRLQEIFNTSAWVFTRMLEKSG